MKKVPAIGLVYRITNKITGDFYIGATSKTLEERWEWHLKEAKIDMLTSPLHTSMREFSESCFGREAVATVVDLDFAFASPLIDRAPRRWIAYVENIVMEQEKPTYNKAIAYPGSFVYKSKGRFRDASQC